MTAPAPPPTESSRGQWTTAALLTWLGEAFTKAGIDSSRLIAEMLMGHVLRCERLRLYTEADRPATAEERDRLRALAARALRHEPVQYLVGEAWFYGMPFTVDRRVLIPRPSTATIVDAVLAWARAASPAPGGATLRVASSPIRIADIGTGSGCIPIALLKQLPHATVVATDISSDALDVARTNAARHGVTDHIEFRHGDLLEPLGTDAPFDVIVSNPPYIPDHEWDAVEPNVKNHEPTSALRGGVDGLQFVRPLIESAPALLNSGGLLAIEIAETTADAVLALARANTMLIYAKTLNDVDGLPRVLIASRV